MRYGQIQLLQSFVLDFRVNQMLKEKGFELSHIEEDRVIAIGQLMKSVKDGYRPPSKWESVFTATFLSEVLLEFENDSMVLPGGRLDTVSERLPEEWRLAEGLKAIIERHPPENHANAIEAINQVLTLCFAFAGEHLDLDADLIEVAPEIEWRDKRPDWIRGLTPQQKCEVGKLMARTGVGANTEVIVEDNGYGAFARFRPAGSDWTEPHRLPFSVIAPQRNTISDRERITQLNEQNRRRQMQTTNVRTPVVPKPPSPGPAPRTIPGPPRPGGTPGRRHYSTGMARFITRVRTEEFLQGENPYAYANSNPTKYTDPSGNQAAQIGSIPKSCLWGAEFVMPKYAGNPWANAPQATRLFEDAAMLLQLCIHNPKCRNAVIRCLETNTTPLTEIRAKRLLDTMLKLANGKQVVEVATGGWYCNTQNWCGNTARRGGVCHIAICERAWTDPNCGSPLATMFHEMSHCHGTVDGPTDQAEEVGQCIEQYVRLTMPSMIPARLK